MTVAALRRSTTRGPRRRAIAEALARMDYLRRSPARFGGEGPHKEWHHFVVHADGLELLVNFSLIDDPWQSSAGSAETARLIVIARSDAWRGTVDTIAAGGCEILEGGHRARFPCGDIRFVNGRYTMEFETGDGSLSGRLQFVPESEPALANNQSLSAGKMLRWLFVPRLSCRGRVRAGSRTFTMTSALAYHDHNWGVFQWGDDFSWDWGSILPLEPVSPWSAVFMSMGDRGRSLARCRGLYLWRGAAPFRIFRDAELRVTSVGLFDGSASLRLPPVMALLGPLRVKDVPARLEVTAAGEGDRVHMRFDAREVAQIVIPDEIDLSRVTVLNEVLGDVTLEGRARNKKVLIEGNGVFEFISH
jgi:hypothetical protein